MLSRTLALLALPVFFWQAPFPRALSPDEQRAAEVLRLGTIRIRTPGGTDFMFRIGSQPIRVEGDALRVAPVDLSAFGQVSIPEVRIREVTARRVVLEVDNGRLTRVRPGEGAEALDAAWKASGEAAQRFSELSIGFGSAAAADEGTAGKICLSFGGKPTSRESAPDPAFLRFCLSDATLHVDFRYLVRDGKLVAAPE